MFFHAAKTALSRWLYTYHLVVMEIRYSPSLARLSRRLGLSDTEYQIPFRVRQYARQPDKEVLARWADTETLLCQSSQLALSVGARPWLAVIPSRWDYDPARWERILSDHGLTPDEYDPAVVRARLAEIARDCSVTVFDLTGVFQEAPDPATLRYALDGHWNPTGHEFAATTLAPLISADLEQLRSDAVAAPATGIPKPTIGSHKSP